MILFADDTSIAVTARNINKLLFCCSLRKNRCIANAFIVNIENFEIRDTVPLNLKLGDVKILSSEKVKFLGVYLDSTLRSCENFNVLNKKLIEFYYAINKLKACLPSKSISNVYYNLV